MITLCHAAKGGSGTTLVACLRAIESHGPVLLVDLEGDVPGMLGVAEPAQPGVVDWLASHAPITHLHDLLVEVTANVMMLPAQGVDAGTSCRSMIAAAAADRWDDVVDWFTEWAHDTGGAIVVDAGTTSLPASFVERCSNRWLVTRACYLSLRRATRLAVPPTGIVVIDEPGRSLRHRDIEVAARAPIIATIAWDVRVARSIDAGLLVDRRLPRAIRRRLSEVAA